MNKLFFIIAISFVSSMAIASPHCEEFAKGVLSNTKGKDIKSVTIEYPLNQREMAQECKKQIEQLKPKYVVQLMQVPDNQQMQTKFNY